MGNWVTDVESVQLKGAVLLFSFLPFVLVSSFISGSFHMASRRQSESYVCVLAPSNTLFETVLFRILRIDWCFGYVLIGSFLGLH